MTAPLLVRGGSVLDVATAQWRREDLLLAHGRVAARESLTLHEAPPGTSVLDASGLLVTPGLVDAQVNGAVGADLTREPLRMHEVAHAMLAHGVTAFVPTVITARAGTVETALAAAAALPEPGIGTRADSQHDISAGLAEAVESHTRPAADGRSPRSRVIGVHSEGPFLAPARCGAHPPEHLRLPDHDMVAGWSRAAGVVAVTLAPELPGALDLVRALNDRGVCVWIGHSEASYEEVTAAIEAGARAVTHLFNAMPQLDHRRPGLVGAALGDGRLVAGLIVDGHHVHPAAVRAAWRALGPGRFMLVSDTTAALDLPPGRTMLGDREVILEAGVVRLADAAGTLAGSGVGLDHCVRTLVTMTGCDPARAFVAATRTPSDLLGRPDLGRLDIGAAADVALWGEDLMLRGVIAAGTPFPVNAASAQLKPLSWKS